MYNGKDGKVMAYAKKENEAINHIMSAIKSGKVYGRKVENVRYPYFDWCLWYGQSTREGACDYGRHYIFWSHYGSSAETPNKKKLNWLIRTIFEMKPSEFLEKYEERKMRYEG